MKLTDSKGNTITVEDSPFARGGEGDVHKVVSSNYNGYCVKIFHPGKMAGRREKLDYMISHPIKAPEKSAYKVCWPISLCFNGADCIGFVMPLSFDNSHSLYDIYLKDGSDIFKRSTKRGMINRYKILYNISNVLNIMHAMGYVMVDFKPQNILFTESGKISIIDLDSIQITHKGKLLFGSSAVTPEYAYPNELLSLQNGLPLTPHWDVYAFAIVAYQILLGIHPFTASTDAKDTSGNNISTSVQLMNNNLFPFGPRKNEIIAKPPIHFYFLQLPERLRALFTQTFDLRIFSPSMSEWSEYLKLLIVSDTVVPNMLRAIPKEPIFILTSNLPEEADSKGYVKISWNALFCDCLTINKKDCSGLNEASFKLPKDKTLVIIASNANKTITHRLVIQRLSLFCTKCGSQFEFPEDLYCTNCGKKREL